MMVSIVYLCGSTEMTSLLVGKFASERKICILMCIYYVTLYLNII